MCNGQGKLIERIQFHDVSLVIQRVSHGPNTSHPSFAISLTNSARAYQEFDHLVFITPHIAYVREIKQACAVQMKSCSVGKMLNLKMRS